MHLPISFGGTDFDMIDLMTGTEDPPNIPILADKYICHGFLTKALIRLPPPYDILATMRITIFGSSKKKKKYVNKLV